MVNGSSTPLHSDPIDILLVEDNSGDVRLTRKALKETRRGHSLDVFSDGDDALDFLLDDPSSDPDLVLLGLDLPGTNGDEILETLKSDPQLRHLPVIILTGSEADEDITRCYESRANAYVTKPATHDEFASVIESVERFWFEQVQLPSSR